MTDNNDDDRTTAPVSNEELYVQIQKLKLLFVLTCACFLAGLAYVSIATDTAVSSAITPVLVVFALLYFGLYLAFDERGVLTRLYGLVPGIDTDETVDELEDRLTTEASVRADGRGKTEIDLDDDVGPAIDEVDVDAPEGIPGDDS